MKSATVFSRTAGYQSLGKRTHTKFTSCEIDMTCKFSVSSGQCTILPLDIRDASAYSSWDWTRENKGV